MSEISPRFIFRPDNIIELRHDFVEGDVSDEYLERVLGPVNDSDDYEVEVTGDEYTVRANIVDLIGDSPKKGINQQHQRAAEITDTLHPFTYFDHFETRDGVFSLDFWGGRGVVGVVYPQLQWYLNQQLVFTGEVGEVLGRKVIEALAVPFSSEQSQNESYSFVYGDSFASAGNPPYGLSMVWRRSKFRVTKVDEEMYPPRYLQGDTDWGTVELTTLGSCACLGVTGMSRDNLLMRKETARLYEMQPHNIDSATQSLSLALGMGRIAYFASQYDVITDITTDVEWTEVR